LKTQGKAHVVHKLTEPVGSKLCFLQLHQLRHRMVKLLRAGRCRKGQVLWERRSARMDT
jgi:hypothetical protein